jgi:sporulation protein YlmC with PRC-barrel domain
VTLAELLGRAVETEDGEHLGRLHDLRGEVGAGPPRITGLVVGGRGLLERLGVGAPESGQRTRSGDVVPWSEVLRIEPGRIVVRRRAAPGADARPRA